MKRPSVRSLVVAGSAAVLGVSAVTVAMWPKDTGPVSTDIIIDGPWDSLPDDAQVAFAGEESGAITLPTDPATMEFLLVPEPDTTYFPGVNRVASLGVFQDCLYLGYGDFNNRPNAINIVRYDPTTGSIEREVENIPEYAVGAWNLDESGVFYAAGLRTAEPAGFNNYYFTDGFEWQKRRTLTGAGFTSFAPVEHGGRLYGYAQAYPVLGPPFVLVSDDRGLTWERESVDSEPEHWQLDHFVKIGEGEDASLYLQAYLMYLTPDQTSFDSADYETYLLDDADWVRTTIEQESGAVECLDLAEGLGELLMMCYSTNDDGSGTEWHTYRWDGENVSEAGFLSGKRAFSALLTESDGWLYALVYAYDPTTGAPPVYELVRTRDLDEWETLGDIDLPAGVSPVVLGSLSGRLYLGAQGEWVSRDYETGAETFGGGSSTPLENPVLMWDADVPEGAYLSFRVRAILDFSNWGSVPYVGPDGTANSSFTQSGQELPAAHQGAVYVEIEVHRQSNSDGEFPLLRSVTIESDSGDLQFGAIDEGAGLYAAANASTEAYYESSVFDLDAPLSRAVLFFDADTPEGTEVAFQVRSAGSEEALADVTFVGPNGTDKTWYTDSGSALDGAHDGDGVLQYQVRLSSSSSTVAPILNQVVIVTRGDTLDRLDIVPQDEGPWVAGSEHTVDVSLWTAEGQAIPVSGTLSLTVEDEGTGEAMELLDDAVLLDEGEGTATVSLIRGGTMRICAELAGVSGCSDSIEVVADTADYLDVSSPTIPTMGDLWTPHVAPGDTFPVVVVARDRYGNQAGDYLGTIRCEFWQQGMVGVATPDYTFTSGDAGTHTFPDIGGIGAAGEYSIVCRDIETSALGGAMAVSIDAAIPNTTY